MKRMVRLFLHFLTVASAICGLCPAPASNAKPVDDSLQKWTAQDAAFTKAHQSGDYPLAEKHAQAALRIAEGRKVEDEYLIRSIACVAMVLQAQSRFEAAEPFYIRAIEVSKRVEGEDSLCHAACLSNLALVFNETRRFAQAEPLFIRSIEIKRAAGGNEQMTVAIGMNNLALLYVRLERYAEAEPLYQESIRITRKLEGESATLAMELNNLGNMYLRQGKLDRAEEALLAALALHGKLHPKDHPDRAAALLNLAMTRGGQNRPREAEPMFKEAIDIYSARLSPTHPWSTAAVGEYAKFLTAQGRTDEAAALQKRFPADKPPATKPAP